MTQRIAAVASAAVLLSLAGGAGAQPPAREGRGGGDPGIARLLGLSEAQAAQVARVREEHRPRQQALRQKLAANRDEVRALLESDSPDATAVGETVLEGHRLERQARALRDREDAAVRSLLTPEQQVKLDALREMRGERGPWGGRRGPKPPRGEESRP